VSNKGYIVVILVSVLLIVGGIFFIRLNLPSVKNPSYYDIDIYGVPQFINTSFIELDKIECVKRFRSGFGDDHSDIFEDCRDMKNIFYTFEEYRTDKELKICSPVEGKIDLITQIPVNSSGTWSAVEKDLFTIVWIRSNEYSPFNVVIGWLDIRDMGLDIGAEVSAGQHIGYACMRYNGNLLNAPQLPIWLEVATLEGVKRISYFDAITDYVFDEFKTRGATSRDQFIISKEERDEDLLKCIYNPGSRGIGEYLIYEKGKIPNWVYLGRSKENFEISADYDS